MNAISAHLLKKALKEGDTLLQEVIEVFKLLPPDKVEGPLRAFEMFSQWLSEDSQADSSVFDDLRFRHILIKNFRRYGEWKENRYYGIQMVDSEMKPYSGLLVLGDNGIGKSSVFGALEYWATRQVSEAQYRKIEDLDWYIRHGVQEPDVCVIMADHRNFDMKEHPIYEEPYDFQRFFISENSIQESASYMPGKGEDGNDWYLCLWHMLGIHRELINFVSTDSSKNFYGWKQKLPIDLADIEIRREEARQELLDYVTSTSLSDEKRSHLNTLKKKLMEFSINIPNWNNKEDLINGISDITEELQPFRHIHAIHFLKTALADLITAIPQLSIPKDELLNIAETVQQSDKTFEMRDRLQNLLDNSMKRLDVILDSDKKLETLLEDNLLWNQMSVVKKELNIHTLDKRLQQFRESLKTLIKKFVEELVDDDFKQTINNNFNSHFMTKKEKLEFNIEKIKEGKVTIDVNGVPVHKYFNTFRYRLFCFSLQVVVNLKMMKKYNFSFPIVFDDVFYANDYKNKKELYRFFKVLESQSATILGEEKKLQFLFFTHDEQLIATLQKEHQLYNYGRMLNPEECQDLDSQNVSVELKGMTEYYNLYFPIYQKNKNNEQCKVGS